MNATRITSVLAALVACSNQAAQDLSEAGRRGQRTYQNVCIACHHANPNRAGTLGPAIAGSSVELLEAKVLRGEYPAGYEPKSTTRVMPPFTYLKDKLPDIAAYLAEVETPGS
jgi:mono/diheme cytochrome c family protein